MIQKECTLKNCPSRSVRRRISRLDNLFTSKRRITLAKAEDIKVQRLNISKEDTFYKPPCKIDTLILESASLEFDERQQIKKIFLCPAAFKDAGYIMFSDINFHNIRILFDYVESKPYQYMNQLFLSLYRSSLFAITEGGRASRFWIDSQVCHELRTFLQHKLPMVDLYEESKAINEEFK